ncbi:LacI family DNA-binding transcriptional regulator [Aestuariimicrobium sp. T2.26MG-19.2B]|uniref:LacI family DNA-binding transcriptional regulator n=1 Tax=Aestuariimicrobium sp. T2.26MG-19.2B TaxID=3040679 RepID=UPI0024778811|nr:LacI family DNA-binding transcriptional regulator [Aestuariimicrobium sp. T2.26MG-19.2B]CAI9403774.1 Catabolite control protein A [Aestuariimicrobium sp. T2.26MG-19.2B]
MSPDPVQSPVTVYTVAQRAGVSIATVSRVLQGSVPVTPDTRQKVLDAVEDLGYVNLRTGRAVGLKLETHALVMPSLGGTYFTDLAIGFESTADEFGQSVSVLSTDAVEDPASRVLDLATKVDGMVITTGTVGDDVIEQISPKVPLVLVARSQLEGCDAFTSENMEPMVELVRHVLGHGRTKLRFVGDHTRSRDVSRRYAGFLQAVSEAGLGDPHGPFQVWMNEESGRSVALDVLEQIGDIDALVCANDELALALMQSLAQHGVRCPDDVVITGWDDTMASRYIVPGLTTVAQPTRELGRAVSVRLHERIAQRSPAQPMVSLPSTIRVRQSCGCL